MFDAIAMPRPGAPALPLSSAADGSDRGPSPLFAAVRPPRRAAALAAPAAREDAAPRPLFAATARRASPLPAPAAAMPQASPRFARLVASDLGTRAAGRVRWTLAAAALQTVVVAAVLAGSAHARERRARETVIEVAVVLPRATRARGIPPPPPPPPARAIPRAGAGIARPKPAVAPRPIPPMAIVQPREVRPTMKAPDPAEPREDAGEGGDGAEGGVVGGVVGGVPGGVIGGVVGAEALADRDPQPRGGEIEDAPQYASAGFRKPAERDPGCLRRAIRVPRDLAGYVSGQVVLRFAIGRDGGVGRLEVLSGAPDARIVEAIAQALRACAWLPGADARGQPVALWVILPMRFEAS